MNPHRGEQKGAREVSRRRLAFQHASGERPTGVFARWAPVFMAGTPPPPPAGCAQQNVASDKELWRARRISTFEVPVTCGTTQRNTVAANNDAFHIGPSRRRSARNPQDGRRTLHLLSS